MPQVSHVIPSFLGGEISKTAQGRFDLPSYKVSLKSCLNSFPIEMGAWTRRPGTRYASHTRAGAKGRVVRFDFEQASPITLEFTDGWLRTRSGYTLITTNDAQTVVSISTATPAVVRTTSAHGWSTGNTVMFSAPSAPLLENRQFLITVIDSTHFSIADAIGNAGINGATLGALAASVTVSRIQELATPYAIGAWATLRAVQAETTDILLSGSIAPQALTVPTLPSSGINPVFALAPAIFNDGPYLDPPINGAQLSPGGVSGIVTLSISFQSWSSTKAYAAGSFVTSSSVNYVSLKDQNVGNTPVSSPSFWQATSANAAVNNGQGFLGSDIGRLIRLLSEPTVWASGSTYGVGQIVSYNPSGQAGANTYWQSLVGSNTGNVPGTDAKNWSLVSSNGPAIWTWGKITSLSNLISGGTGTNIGTLTAGGGLAAAFDGVFPKPAASDASDTTSGAFIGAGSNFFMFEYIGKNYGGQQVEHVTVWPSSDIGLGIGSYNYTTSVGTSASQNFTPLFTLNLRASATAPVSSSNGTLLATMSTGNTFAPITLISSDQTTSWNYVWVEIIANAVPLYNTTFYFFTMAISQLLIFSPVGTGSSSAINVEILGSALPTNNAIVTWRLGVYSNTTGWPTCGCYDGGRLFLGGAVANRWDASVSNGIVGGTVNFAPTDQYGNVTAASGISETFNSDSVNPIYWMVSVLEGIIMGTEAGEWLVQAPTTGPLSALNVAARRVTAIGSSNIEPRKTEHTTLFIKRYGVKLMEYFADIFSGRYTAPNIADKAEHLTRAGLAELAYTEAVTPIAWARCNDGSWLGTTYKRDTLSTSQGPTYAGFHRHLLGTGRVVESISSGPSVGGTLDALTMVTNDTSLNIRHVEVLTDVPDEVATLPTSWFLDDAVNPTSVSSSNTPVAGAPYGGLTINGLWYLNGKTVQMFAGGLDCGHLGDLSPRWSEVASYPLNQFVAGPDGQFYKSLIANNKGYNPTTNPTQWQLGGTDFVVSLGSIFVPYGDGVSGGSGKGLFTAAFATALPLSQIVVGATYNSDAQVVKRIEPAETGSPNGPAFGKKSRVDRMMLGLVNAVNMLWGTSFDRMSWADFRQSDGQTALAPLQTFTGVHEQSPLDQDSFDRTICWRACRPFPATVTVASGILETKDR